MKFAISVRIPELFSPKSVLLSKRGSSDCPPTFSFRFSHSPLTVRQQDDRPLAAFLAIVAVVFLFGFAIHMTVSPRDATAGTNEVSHDLAE